MNTAIVHPCPLVVTPLFAFPLPSEPESVLNAIQKLIFPRRRRIMRGMKLFAKLKWYWRLRNLPTEDDLTHHQNQVFHAYVRHELAMAKHRDYLNIDLSDFRPY